ncbi:MAG: M23 family metallopeptidase [Clostridia bacterium]|nr:M23 family metallopeptidase [Clostridia bacterium]
MDEEEVERKQEKTARIVYIVLAVVITVTMVISVVSAVNRRKRGNTPEPEISETEVRQTEEVTKKESSNLPRVPYREITEEVIQKDQTEPETQADVPKVTEKTEPTSVERVYVIPVNGYVVKDYTMDMPVYSVTMNDYRAHNGTDISASAGNPVYSFTDGVISKIYYDPMMGQTVEIDHGDGLVSVYQNLQVTLPDNIEVGVSVRSGDVIGAVGETSLIECAEVSHLHFSIMKDGVYEAPADYIGSINIVEE